MSGPILGPWALSQGRTCQAPLLGFCVTVCRSIVEISSVHESGSCEKNVIVGRRYKPWQPGWSACQNGAVDERFFDFEVSTHAPNRYTPEFNNQLGCFIPHSDSCESGRHQCEREVLGAFHTTEFSKTHFCRQTLWPPFLLWPNVQMSHRDMRYDVMQSIIR